MCDEQTTKKYTERNSPPYPANQCPGKWRVGNDGNMYLSVPNKNGIHRWVSQDFSEKPKPKPVVSQPSKKTTLDKRERVPHYAKNYYGLYRDESGHPNKKAHDEIYRTVVSAKGNAKVVYTVLRKYRKEGANDTATKEIVAAQFETLYKKRLTSALKAPKKKASALKTPKKKASAPKTPKKKRVYVDNPMNRRLKRVGKRY